MKPKALTHNRILDTLEDMLGWAESVASDSDLRGFREAIDAVAQELDTLAAVRKLVLHDALGRPIHNDLPFIDPATTVPPRPSLRDALAASLAQEGEAA